tara:strand:- start:55754 stop:56158 length:405 start_codon:yes stop_codon:yes gene_type:complete
MKQYIMMNKENNRVLLESDSLYKLLSGELGNKGVDNFKPLLVKKSFINVITSWWNKLTLTPVNYSLLDYDWVDGMVTEYEWLYRKSTGIVYKVYSPTSKEIVHNPFINMFSHDGEVCIKGIGLLPYEDFLVFNF